MSAPAPLLDFFKRGEVARDVRLLAAEGAIAPRASEQLAILVLLLEDPDPEIRQVADATLNRIPLEALQNFLAAPTCRSGCVSFSRTEAFFRRRFRPSSPTTRSSSQARTMTMTSVTRTPTERASTSGSRKWGSRSA